MGQDCGLRYLRYGEQLYTKYGFKQNFKSDVKTKMITNGSGRGSRLDGFDAPFNMGSARCKIEWNDNFEATYLKN